MFKAIILLKRGENMSHDEFKQWWLVDHSGKAAQLPGVRKIVFNLADDGSSFDGISELWFDSKEAFVEKPYMKKLEFKNKKSLNHLPKALVLSAEMVV